MPYAMNGDVRVHYHLDGNAMGQPLLLQHGFGGSLHDWADLGYVDGLGGDYRLILVDGRGHGLSDKPHDPEAYHAANRAADVVAVLDDLGLARAHYFGYSMGGHIGFCLATYAPARCRSLSIGGDAPEEWSQGEPDGFIDILRQGVETWANVIDAAWGTRMTPAMHARQLQNDPQALIASRALVAQRGFAAALPRANIPTILFCGDGDSEHDGAQVAATIMPQARFVSLPGLDHLDAIYRTDLVLPMIMAFLAEVG